MSVQISVLSLWILYVGTASVQTQRLITVLSHDRTSTQLNFTTVLLSDGQFFTCRFAIKDYIQ